MRRRLVKLPSMLLGLITLIPITVLFYTFVWIADIIEDMITISVVVSSSIKFIFLSSMLLFVIWMVGEAVKEDLE